MTRAEEKAKEYANNFMLSVDHENDVRDAYWDGYSQAEKDTINRAVEWLEQALSFGIHPCNGHSTVMQFKEAMEKEETE